uniref:Uncharacterized protein n=1 Tax=Cucumis melo TaxID=3656 RepID=A0A9I9E662_CUCME
MLLEEKAIRDLDYSLIVDSTIEGEAPSLTCRGCLDFLDEIRGILNSRDAFSSTFTNGHSKLLFQSHHDLNLLFYS